MIMNYELRVPTELGDMIIRVTTITPDMAKDMLKNNTENRTLKSRRVQMYANDMLNGNWKMNGDTIVISDDGVLKNGQHRLHSIIAANKPLENQIIVYLPKEQASCYDIGASRSIKDIASLEGLKDSIYRSASLMAGIGFAMDVKGTQLISKMEILREMEMNEVACEYVLTHIVNTGTKAKIRKAGVIAAIYNAYINGYPREKLDRFCEVLVTGIPKTELEYGIVKYRDYVMVLSIAGRAAASDCYYRAQTMLRNYELGRKNVLCKPASTEYYKHATI
jgi:hypothetical protein